MTVFGTPAHMLARSDASDTSYEAAEAVDTTALEAEVYRIIVGSGERGVTQDDVLSAMPGHPYSSVTARFSALIRKSLVVDTGERRQGRTGRKQRVLIASNKETK